MYNHFDSANPKKLLNAVKMADQVICLPIYPELKKEKVDFIISKIN